MAYLKAHYPLEYFTVLLSTSENSVDKVAVYVQSARAIGINVLPPCLNDSDYSFQIKDKTIVFGFNAIKGIGNETINKILEARASVKNKKFTNYTQAIAILANNGIGQKTMEVLIKVGAFDQLLEDKTRYFLLTNLTELFKKIQTITTSGEFIIKPILKQVEETIAIKKQLDDEQFNLLGISFVEHPLTSLKQKYRGNYQILSLSEADGPNVIHALVTLVSHREIKTKTNQAMAFAKIEDDSKIIDVAIFPGVYEKIKGILINNNNFIVTIRANDRGYQALSFKEYHD
jgi:DNA polymerase-3 subunit alpha